MSKQKFNTLVSQPQTVGKSDIAMLKALSKASPYSQIIHSLLAKALSQANDPNAKSAINIAAMYATDRNLLKEIVTQPSPDTHVQHQEVPRSEPNKKVSKQKEDSSIKPKQKKVTIDTSSFTKSESDELRTEIWSDLEALKKSKELYMQSFAVSNPENVDLSEATQVKKKPTPKKKIAAKKTVSKKSPSTVRKTAIKADTGTTTGEKEKKKATTAKVIKTKKTNITAKKATAKISKTAVTKKKTESIKKAVRASSKTEDQKKIIDEFIDKEPSISTRTVKSVSDIQRDLSEKSTNFSDDLVSENLALILVDQGKKEKAVDMYKKLIWKFPQKKSYFAAQIEKLNK